ncbi:MAG: hypothetical protein A2X94_12660 [Bdellovibrionales bacterium GWB1_55_8]|nr:MAG: hypothetical protein A2X94_12660 [Bdellovibrionales bacterium GWB1_55_8]
MKLQLISFPLCPFVQRSVITLKHKGAPFELTFIQDLENPPAWFAKASPLGKVPVLLVHGKAPEPVAVFESAVINEYIDETIGTPLHSSDPLQKALERAWIEYGSELLGMQYGIYTAESRANLDSAKNELFAALARVEKVVSSGPYFRGSEFSLVDSTFAPLFMRLFLFKELANDEHWEGMPKLRAWGEALLKLPEVKDSVIPEFEARMRSFVQGLGGVLGKSVS